MPRVLDNGRVLLESYRAIARAIRQERAITPAAEWLVDNYHIVDEQLREIHDDLPPSYYQELPKLAEGPLEGYPRVYGLAWTDFTHTDSRFDPEMLAPLRARISAGAAFNDRRTLGGRYHSAHHSGGESAELAERVVHGPRAAHQEADALAERLLGSSQSFNGACGEDPAAIRGRAAERAAFAVQLVQRLRDQDPVITPALHWLEEHLAAQGTTVDEMVRLEHQQLAAMNVTVRNVITSMRLISAFDWAEFFESVSLVDAILWTDSGLCRARLRDPRSVPACDRGTLEALIAR